MSEPLLVEIRDLLKSIDSKLGDRPAVPRPRSVIGKPGRVFSVGQSIPTDVDLVTASAGQRWQRLVDDTPAGPVPSDNWRPRDADGPARSTNALLSEHGHVTEVPAPDQVG